ncbi:MAG: CRISPR-associated endonuclease Cas3'' [Candidatus Omnitrophica bacterium]|nr:CRISPR-associated endonuclease Cas3'' [Candidatus Omnitrophota bacterium]
MMVYYAHSDPADRLPEAGGRWHPLAQHLVEVARLARRFATAAMPNDPMFAESAYWAGLLHDLGKYQQGFQDYLIKKQGPCPHAPVGAAKGSSFGLAHAFAPAGHHAGLPSFDSLKVLRERWGPVVDQVWETACIDCPALKLGEPPQLPSEIASDPLHADLWIRMIFSCLVDADWCDTNAWETNCYPHVHNPPPLDPDVRLDTLRRFIAGKSAEGLVNTLRRQVLEASLQSAELAPGFFSLTVPTGGGKTLSSLAFALRHCERHRPTGPMRVIYVIPYLNILEQTAQAFYQALEIIPNDGVILEHHSLAYAGRPGPGDAHAASEASEPENHWARRMEENWEAPIVLTTSVQFFESLFSNRPGAARKLHHIARSVVIFDECQTFPVGLYRPTLDVLKQLVDTCGVSFVFCTATQPVLERSVGLPEGIPREAIRKIPRSDAKAHSHELNRR